MIAAPAGKRQSVFSKYENFNIRLLPAWNQQIKRENKKAPAFAWRPRRSPAAPPCAMCVPVDRLLGNAVMGDPGLTAAARLVLNFRGQLSRRLPEESVRSRHVYCGIIAHGTQLALHLPTEDSG
jgi:hypothetical protein